MGRGHGGGTTFAGGGTINLSRGLSQGYLTRSGSSTTGKQAYQVVRVPQYANVTVTGGLTVQAWNGSSGGILAIDAAGDINLNGQTIDGNGRGFRGAGGVNVAPQCTATPDPIGCVEYRGLIAGTRGGSKGEGLAGTPGRVYDGDPLGTGVGTIGAGADGYVNGDLMRGAPGNAGGGGNQHNAGGGGGGNGGAGGNGGNSWNNSQVTYVGTLVGGFGGSPSQTAAARWVLGGGGGAADLGGNGTTSPDGSGGAAGAMVVLRASRMVGGGTINLNGARGQNSRATDGAGGGGSGGTLVLALGAGGVTRRCNRSKRSRWCGRCVHTALQRTGWNRCGRRRRSFGSQRCGWQRQFHSQWRGGGFVGQPGMRPCQPSRRLRPACR